MENTNMTKISLTRLFEYEGKTYESLDLDLEKLTGNDDLAAENELVANGTYVSNEYTNGMYLLILASRASGIAADVFEALPILDNLAVKDAVRAYIAPKKGVDSGISMDFDCLTGRDAEAIEQEMRRENKSVISPALDSTYRVKLAARASGRKEEELRKLPIREFVQMKSEVRRFLLRLA